LTPSIPWQFVDSWAPGKIEDGGTTLDSNNVVMDNNMIINSTNIQDHQMSAIDPSLLFYPESETERECEFNIIIHNTYG
jgi:hypothetical protein